MDQNLFVETSRLQEFRNFIYGSYDKTHPVYASPEASSGAGRLAQLKGFLKRALPADRTSKILDFGCGDGTLLAVAERLGYCNLFGIDLSDGLIQTARNQSRATLTVGDGLAALEDYAADSLDAVIAFDVLEHLTRPELLDWCACVFRVLSPGGRLLIHVPNGAAPFHGAVRWGDITHESAFTPHSLGQVLRPLGFTNFSAWEDAPPVRGPKSLIRAALWQAMRTIAVGWLAAETGRARGHILTTNLFYTATKAG